MSDSPPPAIAIMAAELLGPAEAVDGLIAFATPLSPGYNLGRAVAGIKRELVACWSPWDLQLAALVNLGGNFDRRRGRTAGQCGFKLAGEPAWRVRQIRWDRSMIAAGHLGGHIGWTSPPLVRRLLIRQWTTDA